MARWQRGGFVSARRAAMIIGVSPMTVSRWCRDAERGEPTVIAHVERASNGFMRIPLEAVLAVRKDRAEK